MDGDFWGLHFGQKNRHFGRTFCREDEKVVWLEYNFLRFLFRDRNEVVAGQIAEKHRGRKGGFFMKKFLAMMMAMMMAFSFAACGGEEAPAEEPEIAMVEVNNDYVTMMVPESFSEIQQLEEMIGAGGPGGSFVITDAMVSDADASDVTEDIMLMMVGDSYADTEMLEYENPIRVDGTDAVYAKMKGTDESTGAEFTIVYVLAFYMVDEVVHDQDICITYQTGEGTDIEKCLDAMIDSIKIG